jgi:hypothetical protein
MVFVLTGYLDESGTHDGSHATIMGGLLARADQWERFEAAFAHTKKRHGFHVFHTKKFKRKKGDFKGWSNEQCLALIEDLAALTASGLGESVTMTLDNTLYEVAYKAQPPARTRLDSKYGLCFRACLSHFIKEAIKRKHRKKYPELHVVLESGHPNVGDAIRIFNETKMELDAGGVNILRTLIVAEKDKCDQLMMADFLAHMEFNAQRKALAGHSIRAAQPVPRGKTGVTNLIANPAALADMREACIDRARANRYRRAQGDGG